MKRILSILIFSIVLFTAYKGGSQKENKPLGAQSKAVINGNEIFYHVFQRSFYDSNNDRHGDLNGITQKIDYFKELGVTSLLFTPLYESIYYHNYFPDDFKRIDSEFGSLQDYLNMIKKLHANDMKFYMDMEIHYVTKNHPWFKDSFENPTSKYSNHVIYNGEGNTKPETMIFNLTKLESYDGSSIDITTVDLYNEDVKKYFTDLFSYWVDPNGDGNFDDGVDGFRIDHMMDDLDWKGIRTNLFVDFWAPLFKHLKSINPNIKIFGEQANWSDTGEKYFNVAGVDMMFAFGLREGIVAMDKKVIENKIDTLLRFTPKAKNQLLFIENHDTPRYASLVQEKDELLRLGGFLMLMNKGIPSIYYGQEIGMKGFGGFGRFNSSDGNDIPMREAFEWYEQVEGPGMALWYKDTGPWWDETSLKNSDGISYEEQKSDDKSLFNFYRSIIEIRTKNPGLFEGDQILIENGSQNIITYLRQNKDQTFLVAANTIDDDESTTVNFESIINTSTVNIPNESLVGYKERITKNNSDFKIHLGKYGFAVWQIQ